MRAHTKASIYENAQEAELLAAYEAAQAAREITEKDIRRAECADEKACAACDKALGALLDWRNDGPAPRGHCAVARVGGYWCARCKESMPYHDTTDECQGKRGARHPRPSKETK